MKRFIAILILLTLLLLPLESFAIGNGNENQHVNYIMDVFNEDNGLPTGEANTIIQSQDGYLWIGSYGGLIRYDGSSFVDFSGKLASSAIRSLFEGSDGSLFVGTNDAGAYRFKDDVFTPLVSEDGRAFRCVRDFTEGTDGTVYVASTTGVAKLDGDTLVPYTYSELDPEHFLNIILDGEGNIWAMSDSGNICVFNGEKYIATVESSELFENDTIYAIGINENGHIYVGSSEGRLTRLANGQNTVVGKADTYVRNFYDCGEINSINRIKALPDGTVMISALNGFGFLDEVGVFHRIDKQADNNISANWAEVDHEGNRWVASSNYGVLRYSVGCFDSCNYNSDLSEYTINAVTKSGDRFYLATDNGMLVFDSDWNKLETELTEVISGFRVRNAATDAKGRVWMATYSHHGAACYDPATDKITDFGEAEGLLSEKIRVVYPLSDGRMLVGSQLGINIIENGKITESYSSEDGMENTSVLCAMELKGRIYVGTDGSGIYEIVNGKLVNMSYAEGLSQGVVLRMEPDSDGNGNFYVCAGDKLFYCENGQFRMLSGMAYGAGSIYSVYDMNGRLWLLQNGGICSAAKSSVLAGEDAYTTQYGVKCGMTGTLSANTWNWLSPEGALYMPTRSGVSKFYFHGPDVKTPNVILNSITVDDVLYEHPKELKLESGARRMTVDISELLFSEMSEFMLGYKLEGFDTDESFTLDKHVTVSYTNLKGGEYALQIRVIDPLTGESSEVQSIPITKELRLVESPWFYVLSAILLALLIIGLMRYYSKRQTAKLLKKQEEQARYISDITTVFSECVDMRDAYTNGHSARVAKYTAMLAKEMGKSPEVVDQYHQIALLHDVGKISIPDAVLNKPGRLTDEEYAVMKSHSQRGYEVLQGINIAPELALGAGCHHERYDGKGYPRGLRGDEIPEVAQIIGVADTFDAMYSTRPYRKKMALSDVVAEIKRCSGTQLSPRVVDAFLKLVDEGAFDADDTAGRAQEETGPQEGPKSEEHKDE